MIGYPSTVICVQQFLGDDCISEIWMNGDDESDLEWVEWYKDNARKARHPSFSVVLASYIYETEERVVPEHPSPLSEVVG